MTEITCLTQDLIVTMIQSLDKLPSLHEIRHLYSLLLYTVIIKINRVIPKVKSK
jgi:hypothetical protein